MLKNYFPERDFKALLFDFDGTIADTMDAHFSAWNKALAIYNLTLSREQHLAWAGRPTKVILQLLNDLHKIQIPPEDFLKEKERFYTALHHEVKAIVSVLEVIQHYHKILPMAVVTGSRRKQVETTIHQLKLAAYFDVLVCAEDYANGKPAPDCFLLAAKKLNTRPEDCLVFEDAQLGIEAALSAGMTCLKVDHDHDLVSV
jgi:beta-phosphoglucomutase family hydrolase